VSRRRREESGSALVEFAWLGLILMVPLIWIVLSVFEVQRGAFAISGAARAAGRAYALADSDAAGLAQARAAVRDALDDQGAKGQPFHLRVTCGGLADCHARGAVITVRVATKVKLPMLPDMLGSGSPSFALDSSHTVPIGQFHE
jgi:Flp pilus assembly protein TadG